MCKQTKTADSEMHSWPEKERNDALYLYNCVYATTTRVKLNRKLRKFHRYYVAKNTHSVMYVLVMAQAIFMSR